MSIILFPGGELKTNFSSLITFSDEDILKYLSHFVGTHEIEDINNLPIIFLDIINMFNKYPSLMNLYDGDIRYIKNFIGRMSLRYNKFGINKTDHSGNRFIFKKAFNYNPSCNVFFEETTILNFVDKDGIMYEGANTFNSIQYIFAPIQIESNELRNLHDDTKIKDNSSTITFIQFIFEIFEFITMHTGKY